MDCVKKIMVKRFSEMYIGCDNLIVSRYKTNCRINPIVKHNKKLIKKYLTNLFLVDFLLFLNSRKSSMKYDDFLLCLLE